MGGMASRIADDLTGFLTAELLAPGATVTPESELSELGVDSFALMEIILFVERRYGVVMPMEQLTPDAIRTVGTLSGCLARLVGPANG